MIATITTPLTAACATRVAAQANISRIANVNEFFGYRLIQPCIRPRNIFLGHSLLLRLGSRPSGGRVPRRTPGVEVFLLLAQLRIVPLADGHSTEIEQVSPSPCWWATVV
jgi:hypothetical protein